MLDFDRRAVFDYRAKKIVSRIRRAYVLANRQEPTPEDVQEILITSWFQYVIGGLLLDSVDSSIASYLHKGET